jgi:two-component system sensor histidine kinase MtrB
MKRLGLRTRVTAGFAAGALAVSASMAVFSYQLTRSTLLSGRERNAMRAAYVDASAVNARLDTVEMADLLRSLDTGASRRVLVIRGARTFTRNADSGLTTTVPTSLRELVARGHAGSQRVYTDNGPAVVIGIPLTGDADFYVVDSLNTLDQTLQVLALILALVAAGTTGAGAAMGWYASRRVLRPLTAVAEAAEKIAGGAYDARLDPAAEPDLKTLTTSFNGMVDQLATGLERDRRFAADVSHELRSPLQTLSAAASVLNRRQDQLDERSATAARLVSAEVDRFQRLVTDLLELARGDQEPDRAPVDVAELARAVCTVRSADPALVQVDPDSDALWAIDKRRFEQVLVNLLDNADLHGGGAVAVRIGQTRTLRFLEVDDEGPGVRPQDRTLIFDRFVRAHNASARGDSDGTGLGLALVAQHVSAHGGRVLVTDRPGGGARFRVELPEARQ